MGLAWSYNVGVLHVCLLWQDSVALTECLLNDGLSRDAAAYSSTQCTLLVLCIGSFYVG